MTAYPRSLAAPTGRAKCAHCAAAITAGSTKIEVEQLLQTPRGPRPATASLHPECALAWVAASGFAGGKRAFCARLAANGAIAIPELAPTDTRPEGTMQALHSVFPQWGTTSDLPSLLAALEGRAWSKDAVLPVVDRVVNNTDASIRTEAVLAVLGAVDAEEREAVAESFLGQMISREAFDPISLAVLPSCPATLGPSSVQMLLAYGSEALLDAAKERIAPRERGLALIPPNPVAGRPAMISDGRALALADGADPDVELNGLRPLHAAVIAGLPAVVALLARRSLPPLTCPLRLSSFVAAPRTVKGPDGETGLSHEYLTLDLAEGTSPLALVDAILETGERVEADVVASANYASEDARDARLAELRRLIARYRAVREALIAADPNAPLGAKTASSGSPIETAIDALYASVGRPGARPSLGAPSGRWAALDWQLQQARDSFAPLATKQSHSFVRTALSPRSVDGFLGGRSLHLYNSTTETGWDWDSSARAIDRDALPAAAREAATTNEPIGSTEDSLWLLSPDDVLTEVNLRSGEVSTHGPVDEVFVQNVTA